MWRQRSWNKYGAKKQNYGGILYHSKFEAGYARDLDLMLKAGEILGWSRQIKISLDVNGRHITNYYVDFEIQHKDGTVELIECKGFETEIFRLKRLLLEATYLQFHPEVKYTIVKQGGFRRWWKK